MEGYDVIDFDGDKAVETAVITEDLQELVQVQGVPGQ
jgi:hypothetical protein